MLKCLKTLIQFSMFQNYRNTNYYLFTYIHTFCNFEACNTNCNIYRQ